MLNHDTHSCDQSHSPGSYQRHLGGAWTLSCLVVSTSPPLIPDQVGKLPEDVAKYVDSTGYWSKELFAAPFPKGERASFQRVGNMNTFTSTKQASYHFPNHRGDGKRSHSSCQIKAPPTTKQKPPCQFAHPSTPCSIEEIISSSKLSLDR